MNLQQALTEVSDALYQSMDALLPRNYTSETKVISLADRSVKEEKSEQQHGGEAKVIEAMRYSSLSGGKRLRPFLTVSCAKLFGVGPETSIFTAAAIEMIHTYSLVHDDLPAMDDDPMRRGQPSCHVKFGEAAAILAGDALLTYAFQVLASPQVHPDPSVRCELIREIAKASGVNGMVGGQMMDLDAEHKDLSAEEVIRLQRLKTGELFAISCESGAILGKSPQLLRTALQRYAHDIGLAFQITDDLLDAEGTRDKVGKEVKKDKIAGKATMVSVIGIERAREHALFLARQAKDHLNVFDKKADNLRALADFVVTRKS